MLTKLSLFSGIGGDDLASEWAGIKTVCFVEKDKFCQEVLHKHWPNIPIIEDVKDVTKESIITHAKFMGRTQGAGQGIQSEVQEAVRQNIGNFCTESKVMENAISTGSWSSDRDIIHERWTTCKSRREGLSQNTKWENGITIADNQSAGRDGTRIDIVSAGFPCQPHSVAGKRRGSADERDLWPEVRRVLQEIKPRWFVGENVPGMLSSNNGDFFGGILSALASLGYSIGWCTYGAVDVGALHRRDRVFIVGYAKHNGQSASKVTGSIIERSNGSKAGQDSGSESQRPSQWLMADSAINKQSWDWRTWTGRPKPSDGSIWAAEPDVGRVANGIPHRVDRLKALGNAVVPAQIYPIYKAIVEIEGKNDLSSL